MKDPKSRRLALYALIAVVALPVIIIALDRLSSDSGDWPIQNTRGDQQDSHLLTEAVTNASCQPGEPVRVEFVWNGLEGATGQRLELGTTPESLTVTGDAFGGGVRSRSVEGLEPGTVYYWRIVAETSNGEVPSQVKRLAPCAPTVLEAAGYTCDGPRATLHLEWTPGVDESGLGAAPHLELSVSPLFADGLTWTRDLTETEPAIAWPGLVANVEYHYRAVTEREGGMERGETETLHVACDTVNDLPCHDILVPLNKQNRLGADCSPEGMVLLPASIAVAEQYMTAQSADALLSLLDAALAEGHELFVTSAYRSYDVQSVTFNHWVDLRGIEAAEATSARPGHSEHQLGTTADLTSPAVGYELTEALADTPEGWWIADNAHRFGFVLSYPEGLSYLTGYDFEPWHLRYVGEEVATAVRDAEVTLHEYLLIRWYADVP